MIESIRVKNFRKHEDLTLDFDKKFNLIHGRNNAGKSTLFYGIEYCLFGNVQGFKKIAQLAKFKKNAVGVQLIFRGKDGNTYKLQRMHKLKGKSKSAQGFYTLKKITDDGEIYLLSSDHGNREEDLSLKINQILGISKRFFETGIHFYQGSVSDILSGDTKLDIVFGIKSAIALADVFKDKALEFEREIKNIPVFESNLTQSKSEKEEYRKKLSSQEKQQANITEDIKTKENELKTFEAFKSSSETLSEVVLQFENKKRTLDDTKLKEEVIAKEKEDTIKKFGMKSSVEKSLASEKKSLDETKKKVEISEKQTEAIQQQIRELEKDRVESETLIGQKKKISEELDAIIKEMGNKDNLEKKLVSQKSNSKDVSKKLATLEKENEELQKFFREIEREKGDIEGMLTRREQSKGKPTCEYCGAPIDPAKIKDEIKQYKATLTKLDETINANEKKSASIKSELLQLRDKEKIALNSINEISATLEKIDNLSNTLETSYGEELDTKLDALKDSIIKEESSLADEKKTLATFRQKEQDQLQKMNELQSQVDKIVELDDKISKIYAELENIQTQFSERKDALVESFKKVKAQISENLKAIKKKNDEESFFTDLEKLVARMGNIPDLFSFEEILSIKEDLKELIIKKISEISTSLSHLTNQKGQLLAEIEETKDHVKRLDRQIANTENEIQILHKKEKISERYRSYQNVFKEAQSIIRENASDILEKKILEMHKILSTTDEFDKVLIDSNDYSLSVTPKGLDVNEAYPAALYEGGGHKLMLGLSYKFSLGKIIGNAPFLLIDEPTEFMDVENRVNLLSNLPNIADGTQILLITHQDVDKIQCDKKIGI